MRKKLPKFQLLGKQGEEYACSYLQSHGYSVIKRNYRIRYGEIDIIAQKNNCLVFVEVKTRSSTLFGSPEEAVTPKKVRELIRTAQFYVLENPKSPKQQQIDVIALEMDIHGKVFSVRHIENITETL